MLEKPLDFIKDPNQVDLMKHIFAEAFGNIIELSVAPTATNPKLRDKTAGQYGNDLYFRIANKIYKFSSDSQITITSDEV